MAKDPEAGAMNEESISYLEEVKKGKPRKFAMICKGASVVSLVIYKKGNVEKRKKEAKEAGKGQFYFGVVDGKGINIRFVLSRADGFDSAPVKTTVLKSFLDESAEFKCKPLFEIVDATQLVLDEDDPLVARFLKLQGASFPVCEAFPDRATEINGICKQIGGHLDREQLGEATSKIEQLESLLGGLGSPASSTSTLPPVIPPPPQATQTESTAPVVDASDALKAKLQEALNKIVPQLKQAVATYPDRKVELLTPVAAIKKQLESGDLKAAREGILSVGQILKSVLTGGSSTSPQTEQPPQVNPQKAEYERKLSELQPNYEQSLQEMLGDTSKFRAVMTYATEQAEAGVYGNAIKAIDRLQAAVQSAISQAAPKPDGDLTLRMELLETELLKAVKANPDKATALMGVWNYVQTKSSSDDLASAKVALDRLERAIEDALKSAPQTDTEKFGIRAGIVAERRIELEKFFADRLSAAQFKSEVQIKSVEKVVAEQAPDQGADELASAIQASIDGLYDEVRDALNDAINAEGADRDGVVSVVKAWRDQVAADPLIQHMAQAQSALGVTANVLIDFEQLFTEVTDKVQELTAP